MDFFCYLLNFGPQGRGLGHASNFCTPCMSFELDVLRILFMKVAIKAKYIYAYYDKLSYFYVILLQTR